ncbi:MAG: hypothetical protein KF716_25175 [Anaerolineae bacterium]|nr:hypothetical protein [Anaerolineae bacterium]
MDRTLFRGFFQQRRVILPPKGKFFRTGIGGLQYANDGCHGESDDQEKTYE